MTTVEICEVVRRSRSRGMKARALEISNQAPVNPSSYASREEGFTKIPSPTKKDIPFKEIYIDVKSSKECETSLLPSDEVFVQTNKEVPTTFPFSRDNLHLLNTNKMAVATSDNTSSISSDPMKKHRLSRQPSGDVALKPIREDDHEDEGISLSSTQHLRSGFFRTIKKQYPTVAFDGLGLGDNNPDSGRGESPASIDGSTSFYDETSSCVADNSTYNERQGEEELPFMSSMARKRLKDLRKVDPTKVDVTTGLQWIRLELHEMREQDKALFLQLIKLHSTIKEIRSELNVIESDSDCCFDDINDAASLWWPRCNSASVLPDFSSSDGAQLLKRQLRPPIRRGASFNQTRPARYAGLSSTLSRLGSGSLRSFSSSLSSSHSASGV